ncbi:adhesin, partial [Corynebacterium macginleyi]
MNRIQRTSWKGTSAVTALIAAVAIIVALIAVPGGEANGQQSKPTDFKPNMDLGDMSKLLPYGEDSSWGPLVWAGTPPKGAGAGNPKNNVGWGWCVEPQARIPLQTRNLYDKANAEKLDIPAGFEDAAINVARHLMSAVAKKDSKSAANYSVYLAALVSKKPNSKTSAAATITGRDPKYGSQNHAIVNYPGFTGNHEDFTKLTGYKIVSDYDPVKFEKVQEVNIPPRPNGAFITVVKPQKDRQNRDQPVAPVDQPGLPPLEEEKPEKEQPKISTKAEFAEGDKQVVAGATVN